jgi:hypothetical protein
VGGEVVGGGEGGKAENEATEGVTVRGFEGEFQRWASYEKKRRILSKMAAH